MSSPCPLTKNYVQELSKYIAEDVEELLYESLVEEFNSLAKRAEVAGNEIRVVQLRAFTAIEIMYYALPKHHSMGIKSPPSRSWSGLTQVVNIYTYYKDNFEADSMERSIIGDDVKNDTMLLSRSYEKTAVELFGYIIESSILLRRALRRRDAEQIPRIGTYLAQACKAVNATPTRRVHYLRMLIDTTEEQAERAWERLTT